MAKIFYVLIYTSVTLQTVLCDIAVNDNDLDSYSEDLNDISSESKSATPDPLTPVTIVTTQSKNGVNFEPTSIFGKTCETADHGVGSCVSILKCDTEFDVLTLRKIHCGFDGNNPKICCPFPGIPTVPTLTTLKTARKIARTTPTSTTSTTTTTTTSTTPPTTTSTTPPTTTSSTPPTTTSTTPPEALSTTIAPEIRVNNNNSGNTCNCISLYNCQEYMKLLQDATEQSVTILQKAHCGFNNIGPMVCCPLPSRQQITARVGELTANLLDPPHCGQCNASFSRVIGGVNATLGDLPWMALLGYKNRYNITNWLCGGSLISSRHVLTAAHCIHNLENSLYVVRLGELDLARDDDGTFPVDVLINQMIKHEQYNTVTHQYDIGILILGNEVQFTDLIRPICLPKDSKLRAKTFENYTPLVAGWGHIKYHGPSASHLQVLQIPVVSNDFCSKAYTKYNQVVIDDLVMCTGYKEGGKDACQGDSGGPLMQPIWSSETKETFYYQVGVVSYGKKCALAGFPGVYTRITSFIGWIEDHLLGH